MPSASSRQRGPDGVRAPSDAQVSAVLQEPRRFADAIALDHAAIDLVEVHSPEERDWVQGQRVPQVK